MTLLLRIRFWNCNMPRDDHDLVCNHKWFTLVFYSTIQSYEMSSSSVRDGRFSWEYDQFSVISMTMHCPPGVHLPACRPRLAHWHCAARIKSPVAIGVTRYDGHNQGSLRYLIIIIQCYCVDFCAPQHLHPIRIYASVICIVRTIDTDTHTRRAFVI